MPVITATGRFVFVEGKLDVTLVNPFYPERSCTSLLYKLL